MSRKSMEDFNPQFYHKEEYPGLPSELLPLNYWISDSGHCVMCVVKCFLDEARAGTYDDYEVAIPVKYVLEKGFVMENGYAIVDVPYDRYLGAQVPSEYSEFR